MSRHRFHGDPARFEVVADFVADRFGGRARYVADVAGGQGMLSRLLNKRGFESEVVDPRGWTMVGVASRQEEYRADMATYYDLVVGLHPDEALREVVLSAVARPTVVIPCCNFWTRAEKLGRDALLATLARRYQADDISFERVKFGFRGPQNIGFVTHAGDGSQAPAR